jgi:hypothetical protein
MNISLYWLYVYMPISCIAFGNKVFYYYYHQVETSTGGLLVPKGNICTDMIY